MKKLLERIQNKMSQLIDKAVGIKPESPDTVIISMDTLDSLKNKKGLTVDEADTLHNLADVYINWVIDNYIFGNRQVTLVDFQGFPDVIKNINGIKTMLDYNTDSYKSSHAPALRFMLTNAILLGEAMGRQQVIEKIQEESVGKEND